MRVFSVLRATRFLLLPTLLGVAGVATAAPVALDPKGAKAITFEDIPSTVYRLDGEVLVAEVKSSASFLLFSFTQARPVQRVRFEWSAVGGPAVKDAAAEETKAGDDALLRIGLLLSGEAPMLPILAPAWMKAVKGALALSTDHLLYLTVGSRHKGGQSWKSPHSDSIESLALESTQLGGESQGWHHASVDLPKALSVVGLWIMADGDDTKATFTAKVRQLTLD